MDLATRSRTRGRRRPESAGRDFGCGGGQTPLEPPKRWHALAAEALDGPRHAHSSHRRSRGDRPGRCLGSQAGRHVAGMVEPKEYFQDAAKRALPGANLHRTPTREIGRPGRFPDAREPESQDTCPACRRRPADPPPTGAPRRPIVRASPGHMASYEQGLADGTNLPSDDDLTRPARLNRPSPPHQPGTHARSTSLAGAVPRHAVVTRMPFICQARPDPDSPRLSP